MRIDQDGVVIGGAVICLCVVFWLVSVLSGSTVIRMAAYVFLAIAIFTLSFFRDPERKPSGDADEAVSAADGVVIDIGRIPLDGFGEEDALRIAVFMNVFNVHVNRSPLDGRVVGKKYCPGKKLSAYNKNAEYENEHGDTDIETRHGMVRVRQIAGLIARRVVTRVKEGDIVRRGDRLGIIRFGSRVDVFLPLEFEAVVSPGARVRSGETVIARLRKQ